MTNFETNRPYVVTLSAVSPSFFGCSGVKAPTRSQGNRFGKYLDLRCVAMYGGAPKANQLSRYRQGHI